MAAIFLQKDAQDLLKNKYIVVMGGSIQRSIYKDLIRLLQGNTYLTDQLLRMKGEDSCLKDKLLDGGMRGTDKKGIGYREVRQYQTDFYFLQFVFMTRCYNTYVESVITKFATAEQKPDVIIVNSCLWDITRYGDKPVPEYKKNLQKLFYKLKSALPECLVIWNTNPAISHNPKGGVFIPGLDYLKDSMELHVLEANYYASKVAVENGHDVVDLHYFLRHQIHRRAEDGIHWDMTGHRRITNLLLTHIAQTWGVELPKHIKINIEKSVNVVNNSDHNTLKKLSNVKSNESEKPKYNDIVEVEVPMSKSHGPQKKKNKKTRGMGGKWQGQRHSPVVSQNLNSVQVFNYNHQSTGAHNLIQPQYPTDPFVQQQILNQYRQQNQVNMFQQHNQESVIQQHNFGNNPFRQHNFRNDNFQMLNFDSGQWQPYQDDEPSFGNQRCFLGDQEPQRYNPYQRSMGPGGRGMPY